MPWRQCLASHRVGTRSAWHQKHRRHAVRSGCPDRGARLDALGSRQHPAFGNVDSERGIGRCAAHAGGRARDADGFWRIQVRWAMPAARRVSSIYRDGVRIVHSACRRETDVESGGRCLSDAWKHPWTGAIYRDLPPSIELTVSGGSHAARNSLLQPPLQCQAGAGMHGSCECPDARARLLTRRRPCTSCSRYVGPAGCGRTRSSSPPGPDCRPLHRRRFPQTPARRRWRW